MSRILAIDYGAKRTGLAVTDPLRIIAGALATVPTGEVLEYLKNYCGREPVEFFVVGYPTNDDGTPSQIAPEVELFIEKLKKQFPEKAVVLQDERYTSKEASRIIIQSVPKKSKRRDKALVDKIAAALILEYYMEAHDWKTN
ncbi:MAG: Holliday junction resolvase RuvX [Saprospiraceae bacterium]|nr:Holliday junction resolvase RuvX [Saprospiraceae bacterium]